MFHVSGVSGSPRDFSASIRPLMSVLLRPKNTLSQSPQVPRSHTRRGSHTLTSHRGLISAAIVSDSVLNSLTEVKEGEEVAVVATAGVYKGQGTLLTPLYDLR